MAHPIVVEQILTPELACPLQNNQWFIEIGQQLTIVYIGNVRYNILGRPTESRFQIPDFTDVHLQRELRDTHLIFSERPVKFKATMLILIKSQIKTKIKRLRMRGSRLPQTFSLTV